jgi:glutathione S-transferase
MIVVHHLNESRSQRVLWLLEELGLPYDIAFYQRDPQTGLAPDALKAVHPLGKSPVISDGARVVAESGAIVDYIIRHHGGGAMQPAPDGPDYDDYVQWLHYAEASASLPLVLKGIADRAGGTLGFLNERVDREVALHLGYIDHHLADRDFLMGEALTGADVQLSFVGELAGARLDRSAFPHLEAWVRRFQARPAYLRALERGGPYKFAE